MRLFHKRGIPESARTRSANGDGFTKGWKKRALVIGCPGAGKSTFARRLRDATGLPLYYLDRLFWNADRTSVSGEAFDAGLAEVLQKDCWIIDGNYTRTLPRRLERCDAVFFLDYPVEICLEGIARRRGTVREDMPWVETEEDREFTAFVRGFGDTDRPVILREIENAKGVEVFWFRNRGEAEAWLAR